MQHELSIHRVALRLDLAPALPPVLADRVQLQQVVLNLVINGIEAMQPVTDRPRELLIRTRQDEPDHVLVIVGTAASASPPRTPTGCSTPSLPPNPTAWAWACRSAARSSSSMADGCQPPTIPGPARHFSSPCHCIKRTINVTGRRHCLTQPQVPKNRSSSSSTTTHRCVKP